MRPRGAAGGLPEDSEVHHQVRRADQLRGRRHVRPSAQQSYIIIISSSSSSSIISIIDRYNKAQQSYYYYY